jgi:hypothetical protein
MKKFVFVALLLVTWPALAIAQPDKRLPVSVTPTLDKTAIWVGDDLRYAIRAVYDANVEMVLDNFTKERLSLSPFVTRDIEIRHKNWSGDKKAVEITLTLTTFETGKPELTIPLIPLYYFVRESGALDKERPVDSVPAAAQPVGLRSALVTETLVPRTHAPPQSPGVAAALLPFGLGFAGLVGLAVYGGRRWWLRMHPVANAGQLSREARERIMRDSLLRLRVDMPAAGDDPRKWSGVIAANLRSMLAQLFQIPAAAQTPQELETSLARSGANPNLAAEVTNVLGQCEELRYGRDSSAGQTLRTQLMQSAERLMQSPSWVLA